MLQHFDSGGPYDLAAGIDTRSFVANPGYRTPPSAVTYFFSDRGEFRFNDSHRTDVSLNWDLDLVRGVDLFFRGQVLNVFDNDSLTSFNTQVLTESNTSRLQAFDPFTETPVEGIHWERGTLFGQATGAGNYQLPRTFRLSVGLRF